MGRVLASDLQRISSPIDRGACRSDALQRFSIARMAAEYAALYEAALPDRQETAA
jgi:hypothetical protein